MYSDADIGRAAAAFGLYLVLAVVALVVDRRALLVSALSYVLYAISTLVQAAGADAGGLIPVREMADSSGHFADWYRARGWPVAARKAKTHTCPR